MYVASSNLVTMPMKNIYIIYNIHTSIDTTSYNIHEKSTKQPHQSQGRANL